jgi:hypothetical protein
MVRKGVFDVVLGVYLLNVVEKQRIIVFGEQGMVISVGIVQEDSNVIL